MLCNTRKRIFMKYAHTHVDAYTHRCIYTYVDIGYKEMKYTQVIFRRFYNLINFARTSTQYALVLETYVLQIKFRFKYSCH